MGIISRRKSKTKLVTSYYNLWYKLYAFQKYNYGNDDICHPPLIRCDKSNHTTIQPQHRNYNPFSLFSAKNHQEYVTLTETRKDIHTEKILRSCAYWRGRQTLGISVLSHIIVQLEQPLGDTGKETATTTQCSRRVPEEPHRHFRLKTAILSNQPFSGEAILQAILFRHLVRIEAQGL